MYLIIIQRVRQRKKVSNSYLNKLCHHFSSHSFLSRIRLDGLPTKHPFEHTRPLLTSHNHSDTSVSACLHLLGVSGRFIVITSELPVIRGGRTCLFKAQASQPCVRGGVIRETFLFPSSGINGPFALDRMYTKRDDDVVHLIYNLAITHACSSINT